MLPNESANPLFDVAADERGGGELLFLSDKDGNLLGGVDRQPGQNLFDLLGADATERALFRHQLPYADEVRLIHMNGTPVLVVCAGYASTRILPVIVPREQAARELSLLPCGDWLYPRLVICNRVCEGNAAADFSHAAALLSLIHRAFFFTEGGRLQPAVIDHVLTVRAAALSRLAGCCVRIADGGFGYAPLLAPDFGWCSGVLLSLCLAARRIGTDATVDLLFDRLLPDLPLCHAWIHTREPVGTIAELSSLTDVSDVRGTLFVGSGVANRPDVYHVLFSAAVREISRQGMRNKIGYDPYAKPKE